MRKSVFFIVALLALACKNPYCPSPVTTVPTTPANVRVVVDANGNNILEWNVVSGATSYKVYYSSDGSSYGTSPSSVSSAEYLLPLYGYYEVSAANSAGESAKSGAVHHEASTTPAAVPTFTPTAGTIDASQSITISCTTPGATIYYTTDGTTPSIGSSPTYSSPLSLTSGQTVTITAIATASGYSNSDAASGLFHAKGWEVVGSAGISGGKADYVSLAIDGSGSPFVAYMDYSNSYKATLLHFDGSAWSAVGGGGFSAGAAPYLSLAIGGTGIPYVAFKDNSISGKATVMKYEGSVWSILGSAGFSAGAYIYGSLGVFYDGSADFPYVAFEDGTAGPKLTVMKYDSGSWAVVGSAGISDGDTYKTSIKIAPDGSPLVAYMDNATSPSNKATVKGYTSSAWATLPPGGEGFSSGAIDYPSLAVTGSSSSYTPYLAYSDNASSDKATVKAYSGGIWATVGSEGFSLGSASYTSLAMDGSGNPWVAFSDGANSSKLTVMKYDGSAWSIVGSTGFSAAAAAYISLAFSASGLPYVAYQDGGASGKLTVMSYH